MEADSVLHIVIMEPKPNQVRLRIADRQEVVLDLSLAERSGLIKRALEDTDTDTIPLPDLTAADVQTWQEYCQRDMMPFKDRLNLFRIANFLEDVECVVECRKALDEWLEETPDDKLEERFRQETGIASR